MITSGRGGEPICRRTMLKTALATAAGGLWLPELLAVVPADDKPKKGALWIGEVKFRAKDTWSNDHRKPEYFEQWDVTLKLTLREDAANKPIYDLLLERVEFDMTVTVPDSQTDSSGFTNGKVETYKYTPIPRIQGTVVPDKLLRPGPSGRVILKCGVIDRGESASGKFKYRFEAAGGSDFKELLKAALGPSWEKALQGPLVITHPEFGPNNVEYPVLLPLAPVIGLPVPRCYQCDDKERFLEEDGTRMRGSFRQQRVYGGHSVEYEVSWDLKRPVKPVTIYADAFIPMARVPAPFRGAVPPQSSATLVGVVTESDAYHELEGDNREFVKGGSFRLRTLVVVDLAAEKPLVQKSHEISVSRGFYYKLVRDPSVPVGVDGAYVREEVADAARAGTGGMKEKVSRDNGQVVVKIDASAGLPLIWVAPAIDYHYTLKLLEENGEIVYEIEGRNDGFPAYSLYIEDELVHKHDPRKTGETPSSMVGIGNGEHKVKKTGRIPLPK